MLCLHHVSLVCFLQPYTWQNPRDSSRISKVHCPPITEMDEHAYNFKWTLKKCPCFYCRHYDRSTFITTIEFMFSKLLYSSWQIISFHSNYGFSILLLLCTLRITEIFSRIPIRTLDKLQTTQDKWPSRRVFPVPYWGRTGDFLFLAVKVL